MRCSLINPLHRSTPRDYFGRMTPEKPAHMEVASSYGPEYWDGDRKYGYGGYVYDGRWAPVAEALISRYGLKNGSSVLDLGCGKAHLLADMKKALPGLEILGVDISDYALQQAPQEIRSFLKPLDLRQNPWPFEENQFDLVISLNVFHNFHIGELLPTLKEMERVGRQKYLAVESYRNDQELVHLQCWALTCRSFYKDTDWEHLFQTQGYTGDYEFIFFE